MEIREVRDLEFDICSDVQLMNGRCGNGTHASIMVGSHPGDVRNLRRFRRQPSTGSPESSAVTGKLRPSSVPTTVGNRRCGSRAMPGGYTPSGTPLAVLSHWIREYPRKGAGMSHEERSQ
jgi:hypothetical protein